MYYKVNIWLMSEPNKAIMISVVIGLGVVLAGVPINAT